MGLLHIKLQRFFLLSFFVNLPLLGISKTPEKRKEPHSITNTPPKKQSYKQIKTQNIYYFKQKTKLRHSGTKHYDSPERLISQEPDRNLTTLLQKNLLPLLPNIYSLSIRKIAIKEEKRIIKRLQKTFPDCPLEELFFKLQECKKQPRTRALYHSSDTMREAPLFSGTHYTLLNNAYLIEQLTQDITKESIPITRDFILLRPPGHHACSALGGFCYLNNIILAQRLILLKNCAAKIAIIDLDLHDGNGTRELLETNHQNTFMLNLFNQNIYPYSTTTPFIEKRSNTYTINKTMPSGTNHRGYTATLKLGLKELQSKFKTKQPDYILISAGFDTSRTDSVTRFNGRGFYLEPEDYESYYRKISETFPNSHIIAFLEGGYDPQTLQKSFIYAMKGLFTS